MKNNQDSPENFTGDIRMHIKTAKNYLQVNHLCLQLKTINNIKISSYNWSEKKGLVIFLFLKDPVPLGDVLAQMPMVEKAYKNKSKEITVELNNSIPVTSASVLAFSKECAPV